MCFETLLTRARFINVFIISQATYVLQLFPLSQKTYASIDTQIGILLWFHYKIRIHRTTCQLPLNSGGLHLKNVRLHGEALLLHRTIQLICQYSTEFASQILLEACRRTELVLPLYTLTWKNLLPYLFQPLVEMAYATVAKIPIEQWSVPLL